MEKTSFYFSQRDYYYSEGVFLELALKRFEYKFNKNDVPYSENVLENSLYLHI